MTDPKPKPPGYVFGRPTDYRVEYCEQAIEAGKLGKSKAWICASIGITPKTMASWCEAHPDFLAAINLSQTYSQMWWEDAGQNGMYLDKFGGGVWAKSVSARFPSDWREKSETDLNHKGSINVFINPEDVNL